jgi:hypothetical protein
MMDKFRYLLKVRRQERARSEVGVSETAYGSTGDCQWTDDVDENWVTEASKRHVQRGCGGKEREDRKDGKA